MNLFSDETVSTAGTGAAINALVRDDPAVLFPVGAVLARAPLEIPATSVDDHAEEEDWPGQWSVR